MPPVVFVAAGKDDLQDHRARPVPVANDVKRRRRALDAGHRDGETGGVEDDVRRRVPQQFLQGRRRQRVLEAGDENRQRVQSLFSQAFDQRVDGLQVPGLNQGPVEHQRRDRGVGLPCRPDGFQVRCFQSRPVKPGPNQGPGFPPFRVKAGKAGGEFEEIEGVFRPAVDPVLPQPVLGLGGNRGQGRQFGVGLVVAGKEGHRDVPVPAKAGDFVGAMGPIAAPAEKPDDDQLRVGDDVFGVMIDGMVVAEVQQTGEPEAGKIPGVQFRPRLRQRRQFHIGGRQHDDVARALVQMDGVRAVGNSAGLGDKLMHGKSALYFPGATSASFKTRGRPAVTDTTLWAAAATA